MGQTVLPDPTADLDWSGWNKAIHHVFQENAEDFPSRICVTETYPWRQFTYGQLHSASNVVAHHLVSSGIERGDVVMTYAHRNVDLVIAIIGILKAGATFSVLDPQYPDDRQIIYLDVSRPKGLIVIEKARAEGLSPKVSSWISQNLNLKTTLPKLRLEDDGNVLGGPSKGSSKDLLTDMQKTGFVMPDILVGPDSVPTLSFTSGSEGKPKGVLGRHFSLLYYFPWMAQRFGLSKDDRFTMLSGIAHDPIQRDIFTPLFLGAQIFIPSQEDIQHERLAEWMKEHKCTVTHLTPAMGQILIGGAITQFADLKNAFFVGDILIKRDVRRLQELAPNVQTVNMLGTTETQRAVSYFAIPSRNTEPDFLNKLGDKIPAGKGMKNVQLLVVDRENPHRICDIGESGEIYVRAAGLAEGYLGLEEYTKEKFISNWFLQDPDIWSRQDQQSARKSGHEPWRKYYKGPRDRLYRTGDLGHYMPDGNVECTGRADNQVKVRGFRIELGDIDTNLSQNPFVRENVTLLKRDQNEEHRLVSYFVPEMAKWKEWLAQNSKHEVNGDTSDTSMAKMLQRFQPLRTEIRSYLKTKLADYAVPEVIIPMERFPLNPNGKIERSALPYPSPAELHAALPRRQSIDPSSLTSTEKTLAQIFASILPSDLAPNTISPKVSFFDLGGESLRAQRLLLKIKKTWVGITLPMQTVFENPTLRGLGREIDRALDPQGYVIHENDDEEDDQSSEKKAPAKQELYYSADARDLVLKALPASFPSVHSNSIANVTTKTENPTILLTGSTGFLGSAILHALLILPESLRPSKIILPIRASDSSSALTRIRQTLTAYHTFSTSYAPLLTCLPSDLSAPRLGLSSAEWTHLSSSVDIIIHNGARVHWVSSYSTLRPENVLSTLELLQLCSLDPSRPKTMTFVSSTAVLDHPDYVSQSASLTSSGKAGILESDDLSTSSHGLGNGYAQTKWSSEYLIRAAGSRGLSSSIIRPGYVLGDSVLGGSITDDFLIRLLKGCVQLSARPEIDNTLNACPVNYVARVTVAASLPLPILTTTTPNSNTSLSRANSTIVHNVTPHPRLTLAEFTSSLPLHGYTCPSLPYTTWANKLKLYDSAPEDPHALLPLFDYATEDLEVGTRPVELDDANTCAALAAFADVADVGQGQGQAQAQQHSLKKPQTARAHDSAVTREMIGRYIAYLIAIGFLDPPTSASSTASAEETAGGGGGGDENTRPLPRIDISPEKKLALRGMTGRGAVVVGK
ncbi:MAG: large subunit of alpha-aminoadipate reductase [Chrysothrix sp. TS-e1954]|nr:MAG: large subunit of alpha-aminoadipate reductase [Chrysothrix sp. TS-e1954]